MSDQVTQADDLAPSAERRAAVEGMLRDIATGGLAGLIAGVVVGGVGGRLVMRLAAILVPASVGRFTENGARIGAVTLEGTLLLLLFGGALAGVVAGTIWVVVRPWLPAARRDRVLASIPLALAFGTPLLIGPDNPDFVVLRHDPVVVGSLVVLVALIGPAVVLADAWLDRRLPIPGPDSGLSVVAYASIAAIGSAFAVALTIPALADIGGAPVTLALICVGLITLLVWARRLGGEARPTRALARIGRGVLVAAAAIGLAVATVDIGGALGLT